jgi:hypothetical protein
LRLRDRGSVVVFALYGDAAGVVEAGGALLFGYGGFHVRVESERVKRGD